MHLVVEVLVLHEGDIDHVQHEEHEHEEAGDPVADERPLAGLSAVGRADAAHGAPRFLPYQRPPHIVDETTYRAKNVMRTAIAPRATTKIHCAVVIAVELSEAGAVRSLRCRACRA